LKETDVVRKAKKGDKEAFAELVTNYSERIYNLALRILRNREDAEDIDWVLQNYRKILIWVPVMKSGLLSIGHRIPRLIFKMKK
jgi:hypothetical protein